MADLSTDYMGLSLRNPLIVGSSGLVDNVEGVTECARAGAGAVVLKSLFEEQIESESRDVEKSLWLYGHTEAFEYVSKLSMPLGPRRYLKLIAEAKSAVDIPVIASLNCISPRWWVDFAGQIAAAGADALEVNVSIMPSDPGRSGTEIEKIYLDLLDALKAKIGIPIAVKMGPGFSSVAHMARALAERGASALVLFNRFYQIDMDIEKMELKPGYSFSSPAEIGQSLRWVALLAGRVKCDLASSTGVHDGAGMIKQILAGATAVQVCSTLYINGIDTIGKIVEELDGWLDKHGFDSVGAARGAMSQLRSTKPELYERMQYIKILGGVD
jgi:dihydroorotate dehydrogenase (fumarate)